MAHNQIAQFLGITESSTNATNNIMKKIFGQNIPISKAPSKAYRNENGKIYLKDFDADENQQMYQKGDISISSISTNIY